MCVRRVRMTSSITARAYGVGVCRLRVLREHRREGGRMLLAVAGWLWIVVVIVAVIVVFGFIGGWRPGARP